MLTLIDNFLGFIAPHECIECGRDGSILCVECRLLIPPVQPACYRCRRPSEGFATCVGCAHQSPLLSVAVLTSYEGVAEALIHKLKFERAYAAGSVVAQVIASSKTVTGNTVAHVPTATSRVRERGYDQSALIARKFARETNAPYASLLVRHGQFRQTNSSKVQRQTQMQTAFHVRASRGLTPKRVTLIDDVMTTGATIEAAAQTLRAAGVREIDAIIFARTE